MNSARNILNAVMRLGQPLDTDLQDYDGLLQQAGGRHLILLGESTHGTREFCQARADITLRLIEEKGFEAIAVDADSTDTLLLNRYVQGATDERLESAVEPAGRFPSWVWQNAVMVSFLIWLRRYNVGNGKAVGFYSLDPLGAHHATSMALGLLKKNHPRQYAAGTWLSDTMRQFSFSRGRAGVPLDKMLGSGVRDGLVTSLVRYQEERCASLANSAGSDLGRAFEANRSRQTLSCARGYYAALLENPAKYWNMRAAQMSETLEALRESLSQDGGRGRVVVWAHSTCVGDVGFTRNGGRGQARSLGQLARRAAGPGYSLLVGFTTYRGQVTIAAEWGGPGQERELCPSAQGSVEALLFRSGLGRMYLSLDCPEAAPLQRIMLQRAIGPVLREGGAPPGDYFHSAVGKQFDALIHLDNTTALRPLSLNEVNARLSGQGAPQASSARS